MKWLAGMISALIVTVGVASAAFLQGAVNGGTQAPTPPAIATTWGLTSRTFFDDFTTLATIDTGNTGASGFNWYIQCNFNAQGTTNGASSAGATSISVATIPVNPGNGAVASAGWQIIDTGSTDTDTGAIPTPTLITSISGSGPYTINLDHTIVSPGVLNGDHLVVFEPPQSANKLSIVSQAGSTSVLKMTNVGQTISNYGMGSTYLKNSNNTTSQWNGFTTGQNKSFYEKIKMTFDETLSPGSCCAGVRWPALSLYSYINLGAVMGGAEQEMDVPDMLPSSGAVANSYYLHDYNGGSIDQATYTAMGRGQIATLGAITSGGSGYVNGLYTNVPLFDMNGLAANNITGATANITVSGGAVTSVTVVLPGLRANNSETLTTPNTYLGGTGSGFLVPIATTTNLIFTTSQFHTWETLYIVTGDNGGVGVYNFYFDGMFLGSSASLNGNSIQVSTTGRSSPPSSGFPGVNGEFTEAQSAGAGYNLVIANGQAGGAGDWPLYIDSVEVWQKPRRWHAIVRVWMVARRRSRKPANDNVIDVVRVAA